MDRETRRMMHRKQERIQVQRGHASADQLTEGIPTIRQIAGKGLFWTTKFAGQMYTQKFHQGPPVGKPAELTQSISTPPTASKLTAIQDKINEIISYSNKLK